MRHLLYLLYIVAVTLLTGCTGKGSDELKDLFSQRDDTVHTQLAAMNIYAYQPARALQILDSAVIVGNLRQWRADLCRARIYSSTLMTDQLDSLLGGPNDVRLDSAQTIGERLLSHDSIKVDLKRQREVLEILAQTDRMQNDTLGWMERLHQLVGVCRKIGPEAETDALRTEGEIGAALHAIGKHEEGMAKLDSVIAILSEKLKVKSEKSGFNELDALIITLKRKILAHGSHDRYAETLPLSRQIIERLDDYETHPGKYHDGSHREPKTNQKRVEYIRFYRSQAQSYLTAALASLGEHGNMLTAFRQIEDGVREATAREHIARYNALQQQMEAERQQAKANRATLISVGVGILALLFLLLAAVVFFKNRTISRKNFVLVQQIADALNYKELYLKEKQAHEPEPAASDPSTLTDEQMFQYINEVIVREKLFLNPKFERQTIMDRFNLTKDRVGTIFSKGSTYTKLTNYVQQLRLEYAAKLISEKPEMSIVQIASECGFSSNAYFSDRFRMYFSMKPSEFRKNVLSPGNPVTP